MAQYQWFVKALAAAPKDDWLFVVAHHPAEEMDFAGMQRSPVRPDPAELPWPIFRATCGFGTNFRISLFFLSTAWFCCRNIGGYPFRCGQLIGSAQACQGALESVGIVQKIQPIRFFYGIADSSPVPSMFLWAEVNFCAIPILELTPPGVTVGSA